MQFIVLNLIHFLASNTQVRRLFLVIHAWRLRPD